MFYYVGIVLDKDWESGWIFPSYVLCYRQTEQGFHFLASRQDPADLSQQRRLKKILVTEPYGNENVVDYMSHIWFYNEKKNGPTTFFPEGYLCYFPCDACGRPARRGHAIIIHHVPAKRVRQKAVMTEEDNRLLSERLATDPNCYILETDCVKPHFCQYRYKKE